MKWFILALLSISSVYAKNSLVIPAFLEAASLYHESPKSSDHLYVKPEIQAVLQVLEDKKITPLMLERVLKTHSGKETFRLSPDDQYDLWIKSPIKSEGEIPAVALHAFKLDVNEESDDMFNDDIYAYFFITDGVIPTGKITSIYKGLDEGQSFFFNQVDRAIFPLVGIPAKKPDSHLIIDYGIIESDGDDIKEMQKLSSIIIDIAIAVYTAYDPQNGRILVNLRKEVKALAELLLAMNNDDRLVTNSFGYKAQEIAQILENQTYVEFKKNHKKTTGWDTWDYDLHFRLIRN